MSGFIDVVRLKHGSRDEDNNAPELDASKLTVIVGPNNSGKTTFLSEVEHLLTAQAHNKDALLIIDGCRFHAFSEIEARALIESMTIGTSVNALGKEQVEIGWGHGNQIAIVAENLMKSLCKPETEEGRHRRSAGFMGLFTRNLDGLSRLTLANGVQIGDARQKRSSSSLRNAFLCSTNDYSRFDDAIFHSIGRHIAITPILEGGTANVFLVKDSVLDVPFDSRSYSDEAINYFSNPQNAQPLREQSDGTIAFVGLMLELMFSNQSTLLIDEPETFLHPSLARAVGNEAGRQSLEKSIFAVTHSPDFLLGCLESGVPVNIVRLTREGDGTARLLPEYVVKKMSADPLLRSGNTISALFHSCAVIVEGDSDSAFYREINYRLSAASDDYLRDCLFVTSHGKNAMYKPLSLLRKAGIPAACIVDFDFLDSDSQLIGKLASSAMIPSVVLESIKSDLRITKQQIAKCHEQQRGLDMLEGGDKDNVSNIIERLAKYGVFVVPNGELESWLSYLALDYEKQDWVSQTFERLGSDPNSDSYVQPTADDVWDFLRRISRWCTDYGRCGMA